MDLQDPTFEQFVATMGVTVLAIVAAVVVLMFLIMAGCLKLSVSLIARHRISFLAALGYLFAITVINSLIGSVLGSVVGPLGGLIALPLTIFATLACLSQAGNCGYLRAFGIYIVFCITATIGMMGVGLVAIIPLAMIGDLGEGLNGQFLQASEQGVELQDGEIQEVNWEAFGFDDEDAADKDAVEPSWFDEPKEAVTPSREPIAPAAGGIVPPGPTSAPPPTPAPPARRAPTRKSPKTPTRAPDGTQLNPFFK
ncbi:MAG: hypothetical protein AAF802_25835 [Planctomycetota bacterium]